MKKIFFVLFFIAGFSLSAQTRYYCYDAVGVSARFITGAGNAWMNGASFKQGLKQGSIGAAFGLGMGAVGGAAGGWFSTTPAGQKVGSWMGKHSKGHFFDRKNPNSPFSPDNKLFGKNKPKPNGSNKILEGDVEVGELEATQFGDNPSVYYDEGKIRNKLLDHGYRDNRLDHLGLSEEDFLDKAMKHLALNRALLVEGNNTWVGLINNSPVTFRINVFNGNIRSFNAFAGHSNRVLVGSFTNFGNLFW